jgi:hypothetical protein
MKIGTFNTKGGNVAKNQRIEYYPDYTLFVSYDTNIIKTTFEDGQRIIYLDEYYWNYSATTRNYRNQFLGENTKETQKKIETGIYKLTNLN